ncbi:MAG: vWA domain-containing protein [Alphaproteobacteria bacterium]
MRLRDEFMMRARQEQVRAVQLENEAREARNRAKEMERNAQVMHEALYLMQAEATKSEPKLSIETLDSKTIDKMAKRKTIFLVDGSGSMQGEILSNTINAIEKLAERLAQKGGAVELVMFGDRAPLSVTIDANSKEQLQKIKRGLNSGTDMVYGIAASAAKLDKAKAAQIFIVSDGDILDREQSQPALENLLDSYPKARIDALLIGTYPATKPAMPRHLEVLTARAYGLQDFSKASRVMTHMEQMLVSLKPLDPSKTPEITKVLVPEIGQGIAEIVKSAANKNLPALRRPKGPKTAGG